MSWTDTDIVNVALAYADSNKSTCYLDTSRNSTQALSSTTASYDIEGLHNVTLVIASGAATTPCVTKLQFSLDGTNWYDSGATLTSAANSTVAVNSNGFIKGKFCRAIVTTAGVGQTLTYIGFYGVK